MSREFEARYTRYGRSLADFEVGDVYKHWPGKTITEADNHFFSLLTFAGSPVHIDENYAAENMEGGKNLVLGTYIYSLLTGLSVADISGSAIASLEVMRLKHLAPVYIGDTLYASSEVLSKRISNSKPDRGILTVHTSGLNQDGTLVCSFERSVMLPSQEY